MKGQSGVILVAVLWVVFLVGLVALGLGRVGAGEMALLKISAGRLRAYAAACSGLAVTEQRLLNAMFSERRERLLKAEDLRKMYAAVPVSEGVYFDVGVAESSSKDGFLPDMLWGPLDESGRFNVNMINNDEGRAAKVLEILVDSVSPGMGESFVKAVRKFRHGEERKESGVRSFYALEELLFVEGVTLEFFEKARKILTVYPFKPQSRFMVNVFAASPLVVRAVFKGVGDSFGINAGVSTEDAQTFLQCRSKPGGLLGSCAMPSYMGALDHMGPEPFGTYRIHSTGVDIVSGMKVSIEEVVRLVDSKSLKKIYWHRN